MAQCSLEALQLWEEESQPRDPAVDFIAKDKIFGQVCVEQSHQQGA